MTKIGIFGGQGRMGRAIAAAAPDLGASVAGSAGRGDDPASLAAAVDGLLEHPGNLAAARARAWELGQNRYNWEVEQMRLVSTVEFAMTAGRPSGQRDSSILQPRLRGQCGPSRQRR